MKCELAELEISARLDGARDPRHDDAIDDHIASCARCRSFEASARRLHEGVRLEPAADVPDLVQRIMTAVRVEPRPSRLRLRRSTPFSRRWTRPAAAFLAGAAASALALGGLPIGGRGVPTALANEVPRLVAAAAKDVRVYRATIEVVERNFHPEVPVRRFEGGVWFGAPEIFGSEFNDRTRYPSDAWPLNDVNLAVDADRWSLWSPASCPREALPGCAADQRSDQLAYQSVRGREPFDGDALLPTDIVVPVNTLAGSDRVEVVERTKVIGRPALTVELPYRDATPLFAYLHASGGIWRPFFPSDRVLASLDTETWFPLAYEVRASAAPERQRWATAHGLRGERGGDQLFTARTTTFMTDGPAAGVSAPVTPESRDAGFRDVEVGSLARRIGYEPAMPAELVGLEPYRAGIFVHGGRPDDEVLLSFAKGLAWAKIRQTRRWTEPTLYGNIGSLASEVVLPNGSVAYYEPATSVLGRRLSIHSNGWDVYLESNLPSEEFFRLAASLPIRGETEPAAWSVRTWPGGIVRERVTLHEALAQAPYALLPERLPPGYELGVTHIVRANDETGVTFYFRREGTEPDGIGLKLHQAKGVRMGPPMEPDTLAVRLRGGAARYSAERNELEWVEDGVYRSLTAPSVDLATLLDIARSLAPGTAS